MTLEEKGNIFRRRFLQSSFGQLMQTRNEYSLLFQALSDEDVQRLDDMNVFFCRSYAPSCVMDLKNTPAVEIMRLVIFEAEYVKKLSPEEVVAIFLHEIGHAFNPDADLQQREFNADDFAVSKGYSKHIKSSLCRSIENNPIIFDNPINRARVARLENI